MASMPLLGTLGTINQPSTMTQSQAQQIQQMIAAFQNQSQQQNAQKAQNATPTINSAPITSPVGAGGVLGTFLLNQLSKQNPSLFNPDANPDYYAQG